MSRVREPRRRDFLRGGRGDDEPSIGADEIEPSLADSVDSGTGDGGLTFGAERAFLFRPIFPLPLPLPSRADVSGKYLTHHVFRFALHAQTKQLE